MSILSPFTDMLRSALGVAEHGGVEAVEHSPLNATVALEESSPIWRVRFIALPSQPSGKSSSLTASSSWCRR